jgi:hypothetical protein
MFSATSFKAVCYWLILSFLAGSIPIFGQSEGHAFHLLSEGKLVRAKKELLLITQQNPENFEAQLALAWTEFWLGFQQNANERVQKVLDQNPNHEEAIKLLNEIHELRVPLLSIVGQNQWDDQPMKRRNTKAELTWYRSNLLNLAFEVNQFRFQHDSSSSAFVLRAENTFFEPHSRINLSASLGHYAAQENELIWGLKAGRKLGNALYLEAALDKTPYYYTLASVQLANAIMMLNKELSLTLNHKEKWLGKAAFESNEFAKNETVKTRYVWLLAPIIHREKLKWSMGYAYSYSHSDSLTFLPETDAGGEYIPNPDGSLLGVYSPYFSPKNQSVHWALLSFQVPLGKKIEWKNRLSCGVYAVADNPYLYENTNPMGEPVVEYGYTEQPYYPAEWESTLAFHFWEKLDMQVGYYYQRLFFYTAQGGRIELKYRLGK